jgi:hypothetical protein
MQRDTIIKFKFGKEKNLENDKFKLNLLTEENILLQKTL